MNHNIKKIFEEIHFLNLNGQSLTAVKLLKNIAKKDLNLKNNLQFTLEIGQSLLGASKFKQALKYFTTVLKKDASNIYAIKGRIKSLHGLNKRIPFYLILKTFESDKNDIDIKYILSDILLKKKHYASYLAINGDVLYCLKNSVSICKKQVESCINFILKDTNTYNKNKLLYDFFGYLIKYKLEYKKNAEIVSNAILKYSSVIPQETTTEFKKNIFNYYNNNKTVYETILYLLKIIKTDSPSDIFLDILCVSIKQNSLTENEKNSIIKILGKLYRKILNLKIKNILLNEIEILQKKTILKSKPRQLHVLLTTACNLKCIMCYIPQQNRTYEINEKFLQFIKDTLPYLQTITWQGGEVFLFKEFKNLFEMAGQNAVKQRIITSGLLFNHEFINLVSKYDTEITVSIDAPCAEIYENIRVGANFKLLLKNLELLKEQKTKKYFSYNMTCVLMSLNFTKIKELVEFALFYGFNRIYFQKVSCSSENKFLCLTAIQENEAVKIIKELKIKYSNLIMIETDILPIKDIDQKLNVTNVQINKKQLKTEKDTNLFCFAPWMQLFFDFDDTLKIDCNSMPLMLAGKGGIWNNENIVTYRKSIIARKFTYCNQFCYDKQKS